MPRQRNTAKGTIIADENANRIFIKIAREEGWKIITISPIYRGIKLSDPQVSLKYTKRTHPIFTADTTAYKLTEEQRGKSGYIIHKNPPKEKLEEYKIQIKEFFRTFTEKNTHNIIWIIEIKGNPTKKKITKTKQIN